MSIASTSQLFTGPPQGETFPANTAFERLRLFLEGLDAGLPPINLSLGEPKHGIPSFLGEVLESNLDSFGRYPPIRGTEDFRYAIGEWLNSRYHLDGMVDVENGIIPLNGSREGLFFAAIEAATTTKKNLANPIILIPNPYYLVYSVGASVANCKFEPLDCRPENNFLPDLTQVSTETLERTVAIYLASPANPQGTIASQAYWQDLITLSRKYEFFVFADECYSEIYRKVPPCGLLEAARALDGDVTGLITFNSLSKRSNLPGLRVGFAAGDKEFLSNWSKFRGMAAPQVPLPLQAVAIAAYSDETHVHENRILYNEKFTAAKDKLEPHMDIAIPQGGFFLWIDVCQWGTDIEFTKNLWTQVGLRVVPGSFLATSQPDGSNPGSNYIRIAMVEDINTTVEALDRLLTVLDGN